MWDDISQVGDWYCSLEESFLGVRVRVIRPAIAGKFLSVDNNITLFKGA